MKTFEYFNPVFVKYGEGVRHEIGEILQNKYKRVLLVCSQGPFHENGLYDSVREDLERHTIQVFQMHDVESNPKLL